MLRVREAISRSLKLRLIVPMFAALVGATAGFAGWEYAHTREALTRQLQETAARDAASLVDALQTARDTEEIQRLIETFATPDPAIRLVIVALGPQARIAASTDPELVGLDATAAGHPDLAANLRAGGESSILHREARNLDQTDCFEIPGDSPLAAHARRGAVMLHYSLPQVLRSARAEAMHSAGTMLFLVIVFAGGAFWTLEKHVLSRLRRLGRAVAAFSEHRALEELHLGSDEIGRLGGHILRTQRDFASRERELATIVETAGDGIVFTDTRGTVIQFNRAAEQIFGYRARDILGENVSRLMPAPHAAAHDGYIRRYLETGERRAIGEMREVPGLHRDGREIPLKLSVADVTTDSGQTFVAVLRDLTEERKTESSLRAYASALESATMRAESSAEAKAEFLANMSHEIRTPMTAILGYVDLLMEQATPPRERIAYLKTVKQNGQHLLSLINDILDLSKIEADRVELERTDSDVVEIVGSVVDLLRFKAQEKGIRLLTANDGSIPRTIFTDATRLRQVLVNLVGNAIKFTSLGGVTLRLRYAVDSKMLYLDVEDTGIGMTPEHLERIFEAFGQAEASTSRNFGGTGLGLTISRKLTRKMGGEIHVRSTPDVGSVFSVWIPVGELSADADFVDDLSAEITQRFDHEEFTFEESEPDTPQSRRVLLAEDNPVNQKLIERFLQREGAEVFVVADGSQACTAAMASMEDEPFDIVLMDMIMPNMDGYEATAFLRDNGYEGTIVALTANAMEGDRAKCLAAGCDDYLTKPIQHEEFRRVLRSYSRATISS